MNNSIPINQTANRYKPINQIAVVIIILVGLYAAFKVISWAFSSAGSAIIEDSLNQASAAPASQLSAEAIAELLNH